MTILRPRLEQAKGFIAHGAGPSPEGWRVFEVWESQKEATEFFAEYIHPNLPPGVTGIRTYLELHNLWFSHREAASRRKVTSLGRNVPRESRTFS
jgi:antitoxin component HigA of HigAB toxin-antitoxin module